MGSNDASGDESYFDGGSCDDARTEQNLHLIRLSGSYHPQVVMFYNVVITFLSTLLLIAIHIYYLLMDPDQTCWSTGRPEKGERPIIAIAYK